MVGQPDGKESRPSGSPIDDNPSESLPFEIIEVQEPLQLEELPTPQPRRLYGRTSEREVVRRENERRQEEYTPPRRFVPTFYPEQFRETKDRKLKRDGRQCGGEDISIDKIKNRSFHAAGVVLSSEIPAFNWLMDFDQPVDLISPKSPSGGMECLVKNAELGEWAGYNVLEEEHQFEYTIDLVSTGSDEYNQGENPIVSEIVDAEVDELVGGTEDETEETTIDSVFSDDQYPLFD